MEQQPDEADARPAVEAPEAEAVDRSASSPDEGSTTSPDAGESALQPVENPASKPKSSPRKASADSAAAKARAAKARAAKKAAAENAGADEEGGTRSATPSSSSSTSTSRRSGTARRASAPKPASQAASLVASSTLASRQSVADSILKKWDRTEDVQDARVEAAVADVVDGERAGDGRDPDELTAHEQATDRNATTPQPMEDGDTEDQIVERSSDDDVIEPAEEDLESVEEDSDILEPAEEPETAPDADRSPTSDPTTTTRPAGDLREDGERDSALATPSEDADESSRAASDEEIDRREQLAPAIVLESPPVPAEDSPVLVIEDRVVEEDRVADELRDLDEPLERATVLSVEGLSKSFDGTPAVDSIDLTVHAGSIFGIVGPNGAGKTTTLSMVTGLLRPDAGRILVHGADVWKDPVTAKRNMGVLPDRLRLFDRLTGGQLLYYSGSLRGLDRATVRSRSADLAVAFGLEDALSRLVTDYSAGMTKKIALAAAMIHSPRILILDEPFEAVDPVSAANVIEILQKYASAGGTVVMSSHSMDLIQRICDSVTIIVRGEALASGTMEEVRGGASLEDRFVKLAGGRKAAEGMEWLHSFSG